LLDPPHTALPVGHPAYAVHSPQVVPLPALCSVPSGHREVTS
jgi:hypothetical protein